MKKILLIVSLCGCLILGIIFMGVQQVMQSAVAVFAGNQANTEVDNEERSTCSYIANDDVVFDERTEAVRQEFKDVLAPYFVPIALAIYQTEIELNVNDVISLIKSWDSTLGFDYNLQVYKYGQGYADYLVAIGAKHSLSVSKKYYADKYEGDKSDRAYTYYLDVLSLLNDDCKPFIPSKEWQLPMEKPFTITQDFGSESVAGGLHLGIDLVKGFGATVTSVTDGEVVALGNNCNPSGGYLGDTCNEGQGNYVNIKVEENGSTVYVVYMHLSRITVAFGDQVTMGQVIGNQGHSGNSTGSHLHLEIRRIRDVTSIIDDVYDPNEFMNFAEEE